MGNLVTKITTNNIELNESNVSDVMGTQISPTPEVQCSETRKGFLKRIWNGNPSGNPSNFILRTPIQLFQRNSIKFDHQELNETTDSNILNDLDILTPEEEDSLSSNVNLAKTPEVFGIDAQQLPLKLPDPRSPTTELVRTPILAPTDDVKIRKEENLVKKLAEKLISTTITNEDKDSKSDDKLTFGKKKNHKNLIYEDDENLERFSTPPKKPIKEWSSRTPLSCVINTPKSRYCLQTPTTKSKVVSSDENPKSISRIPVSSARRLQ